MGDLDELRRHVDNKKSLLLEKERQLRQEHENASVLAILGIFYEVSLSLFLEIEF